MKIAVTGASGYLGSVLCPKLIKKYSQVDLLDLNPPDPAIGKFLDNSVYRYVKCDVAESDQLAQILPKYDFIVHLAGLVGYPACEKDPKEAVRKNVVTTRKILKFKKPGVPVLFASTISNYGEQHGRVNENSPVHPVSIYGRTKHKAEVLVLREKRNIVFRLAGVFGVAPTMRHDNLAHDFVRKSVGLREKLSVYENTFTRQFIHIQDVTDAMVYALEHHEKMGGGLFNIGNPGIEITKADLVHAINEITPIEFAFENSGKDLEKRNYAISFDKMLKAGFKPRRTLQQGLADLVEYYGATFAKAS